MTETEKVTLLACPFCGSAAEFERLGNHRQSTIVACTYCGCRLETGEEGTHCGAAWNRRVPDPETVAAIREDCAKIAERMLQYADTTSDADKAIAAAIRKGSAT